MIKVVLDWETAYGKHPATQENITLSKMTTEEYVRHPLFKVHGLGVKIERERAFYIYKRDDLLHFLKTHPWQESFVVCHHTHFDGAILSWRAGIKPAFWGCTLSMARALYPHESVSLANIARLLHLGEKGHELVNFINLWDLADEQQRILGGYCCNDVEMTSDAFDAMKRNFPPSELRLIDLTIRLFTEPVLQVERGILIEEYKRERRSKRALLKKCATDKSVLASNDQFAALLLTLGVDPPKKLSPSKVKDGRVDPDNAGEPPLGILPSFKTAGLPVEDRVRMKEEKNSYPWAYAFGKSDEEFKMLLDHPDEQVQAVVEARMGIKSTIKETRSKRFFKIGKRGAFPVYHNYYGARTGRDSGGDKQNTTNLNRVDPRDPTSGALRRSLNAPEKHVLVVRDLGQIEARKLSYTAGQEDLLDLFRAGGDPYNRQATKIFGYEVNRKLDEFWLEGLAGKASVLGCLGGDTKVLTNRGWVDIVSVRATDTVWDGERFVTHAGVVPKGERECLKAFGVTITPDHEILTESSWQEWQSVLTSSSLFQSALSKASLQSSNGEQKEQTTDPTGGTRGADALAAGRVLYYGIIFAEGFQRAATTVQKKLPEFLRKTTLATLPLLRTHTTESDYLIEYLRAFKDAITRAINSMITTVAEELRCTHLGLKIGKNFLLTCVLCPTGMLLTMNSIEKTMTKGTSREIFDLYHHARMQATKVPSPSYESSTPFLKLKTQTYDIAFAGPRNRFAILTDKGPLLVHNCGYGMGWSKFQESLRVGFMGMPSIIFGAKESEKLGADIDTFCHQRSYKPGYAFLRDEALALKPLNVNEEAHLWHCAAVKQIVDKYRQSNKAIVDFWGEAQRALDAIVRGETIPVGKRNLVTTCPEGFLLPNGMKIRYYKLQRNDSGEFRYLSNRRKNEWSYLYGGKAVENIIQALARIVLTDQMLEINRWLKLQRQRDAGKIYSVVTSTYDEVVCCVPFYRADDCLQMMKEVMATAPAWCPDLPLKSSGGYAVSYGDCEK